MKIFDFSFTVDASLEDVHHFHAETSALKRLSPPPIRVQLHEIEPLGEGSVSTFTLWFGPLPIYWRAEHSDVSQNGFTDTQTKGPAKYWRHTHRFTPLSPEKTRVEEHIEYEHFPGLKGVLTRILFARPNLTLMFAYRAWVTRRALRRQNLRGERSLDLT